MRIKPVRALHRRRVHPPGLARRPGHPPLARGGQGVPGRPQAPTAGRSWSTRLLARPEFADFWTLKFADILRANGRLIETKGTHAFNRWIRSNLERNTPLDRFVRELLTADGSTLRNPAANYYRISRDPENSTETTAQLFLGVRIQCAKCHNHPVRALDAGRLLRLRRLLLQGQAQARHPARGRGGLRLQRRRGPPAQDRQDDEAQGAGRPDLRRRRLARPQHGRPPPRSWPTG